MRRQLPGDGGRQRNSFKLDTATSKQAMYLASLYTLYIGVEGIVHMIVVPDSNTIWFHDANHLRGNLLAHFMVQNRGKTMD